MPLNQIVSNSSSYDTNGRTLIKRALYSSVIAGAGAYFLLGEAGQTSEILSMGGVSSSLVVASAVGAGSILSDYTSQYVINNITGNLGLQEVGQGIVESGVCGAATLLALKVGTNIPISAAAFGVGAVSKYAGDSLMSFDHALLGMLF